MNRGEIRTLRDGGGTLSGQVGQIEVRIIEQLNIQYSLLLKNQHMKDHIERFKDVFNTKL